MRAEAQLFERMQDQIIGFSYLVTAQHFSNYVNAVDVRFVDSLVGGQLTEVTD